MHEMMLVENIADIVLKQAELAKAEEVVAVKLKIGEIRDIVEELMEKCFRFVARGTIAENAALCIERIPLVVECEQCGSRKREDIGNYAQMCCDECGSTSLKLISGREFLIEDIEIK